MGAVLGLSAENSNPDLVTTQLTVLEDCIRTVPIGQDLLRRRQSLVAERKVELKAYPESQLLEGPLSQLSPWGASFVTDGAQGTLYYHPLTPQGLLVAFLVHEWVHAQDERLWVLASEAFSPARRAQVIFQAECLAFAVQACFLQQLKQRWPAFDRYYRQEFPHLAFLQRALTPEEVCKYCNLII
jgi:hypothetical protein